LSEMACIPESEAHKRICPSGHLLLKLARRS
jgi:hypothetical protein